MDLLAIHNTHETIADRMRRIRERLLAESECVRQPNFEQIEARDVGRLFALYDAEFFGGWLTGSTRGRLSFRLSPTMTRAGGKTSRRGRPPYRYEIAVAGRLLMLTFRNIHRPVAIGGLACADRLEALQRILEHEIIHLAELLAWEESSCAGVRFKTLAGRIFGHRGTKHELVTPREQAAVDHAVRVGMMVRFAVDGQTLTGRVNRIHRRATVLVETPDGQPYTDGKRYAKYYVPLERLERAPGEG